MWVSARSRRADSPWHKRSYRRVGSAVEWAARSVLERASSMKEKTLWFVASGLVLALAGCGSSVVAGTGGGNSSSSGSGGGSDSCAVFADAESAGSVTVRFRNNTGLPIYLPSQCTTISYDISPIGE